MELRLGRTVVRIIEGDITALEVGAIVNPANQHLQLGGGVAGAIRTGGGPSIQAQCDAIGHCPVGSAVITTAGRLPANHVIHAVGPRWGEGDEDAKLTGAVRASLELAREKGLESLALPAISTGIFGFPLKRAARLIMTAVRDHAARGGSPAEIIVCLFGRESLEVFQETAAELL